MNFVWVVLLSLSALAAERPLWTSKTPVDTASTVFVVGRSPTAPNEAEGVRAASKDAREQLLRQEFGTTIKIESTQSETLKTVDLDSKLSELSDLILLKGFKQAEVYSEKVDQGINVWTLYSVPRSELKSEKERLEALRSQKQASLQLGQSGDAPSKEYNNGGKPKLRKGLKKSQVIEILGAPRFAEGDYFGYGHSSFCTFSCVVFFEKGRVWKWDGISPELTTDLDDESAPIKPKKALQGSSGLKMANKLEVRKKELEKLIEVSKESCQPYLAGQEPFKNFANSDSLAYWGCLHYMNALAQTTSADEAVKFVQEVGAGTLLKANIPNLFEIASTYEEPFKITGTPPVLVFKTGSELSKKKIKLYDYISNSEVMVVEEDIKRLKQNSRFKDLVSGKFVP